MSISPPSDIILDVARAADPTKLRAAAARLDMTAPTDGVFEATLAREGGSASEPAVAAPDTAAATPAPPRPAPPLSAAPAVAHPSAGGVAAADSPTPADRDFEAMVLSQLFQSMLPQDSTMFGEGTAGSVWSGLFVQELGKAVAAKGGIGVAAALARDANLRGGVGAAPAGGVGGASAAALSSLANIQTAMAAEADNALWSEQ